MLINLLKFIQQQKTVSNQQIARIFKMDLSALEPLLEVWLRRGKIVCHQSSTSACKKKCFTCKPNLIYYSAR